MLQLLRESLAEERLRPGMLALIRGDVVGWSLAPRNPGASPVLAHTSIGAARAAMQELSQTPGDASPWNRGMAFMPPIQTMTQAGRRSDIRGGGQIGWFEST